MTEEELIEAAKNLSADSDYIKSFEERCRKRNKEFQEWEDSQKITKEFLDREYTVSGEVTTGMDGADKIVNREKEGTD